MPLYELINPWSQTAFATVYGAALAAKRSAITKKQRDILKNS